MKDLVTHMAWSDPGQIELRLRRADLRDVLRGALEALGAQGSALRVELPAQEVVIMADPAQLVQALLVLLRGVAAGGAPARLSMVQAEASAGVLVQRDDAGAERPAEVDARAAQLLQLHGAQIGAPEIGSALSIWLPLADAQEPGPEERSPMLRGPGRHVLLVEDNPDIRESLQDLLSLLGHRVDVAEDGGRGLSLALSLVPEAALVDIGLPGMDGYELARRLRAAEAARGGRSIFLVALTGYGRPEDRQRALQAGFSAHLVKPPDPAEIEDLLAAL